MREWIETIRGPVRSLERLPGGAGRRSYWRAVHADGRTSVLMHAVSEDPSILPPALRTALDVPVHDGPFVQITRLLEKNGVPVPAIYATQDEEAWILLEDLGDCHLLDLNDAERVARCGELLELLARVHGIEKGGELPFRRCFDETWIGFELRLFMDCIGDHALREELSVGLAQLAREISELPRVLCLRDLQSQNVLIDANGALRLIDYQDALLAPRELDLSALLHDSYVEIRAADRAALLERYAVASGTEPDPAAFAMLTVQRKCKDLSRFRSLRTRAPYARALGRAEAAVREACTSLPEHLGALADLLPRALDEGAT